MSEFIAENFGVGSKPLDVFLWVGVLIVVYVLFQEKINPLLATIKEKLLSVWNKKRSVVPDLDISLESDHSDVFFDLIKSWKQTRDLAEAYGADKAVAIADEMFPHLVPKEEENEE